MGLMPGYKKTEVGVIPEEWQARPLGALGSFKNGINKAAIDFGHGSPFINLMDVFGVPKAAETTDGLGLVNSTLAEQKTYELRGGDVLFVRSSVKPEGVGLTTLIPTDLPTTVFSGFLLRFRDQGDLVKEFKEHCFLSAGFRRRLIASSTVSANTNVNQSALKLLPIGFPPNHDEQRAIAEALSDVDGLLGGLERLIAKKRDLKQAAMQQLLTSQTRLPGFTSEWEEFEFGEVSTIRNVKVAASSMPAGTVSVELESIEQDSGRLRNVSEAAGISSKYKFEKGDVLFGRLRAYLRKYWLAAFDGICSTEIWPLTPRDGRLCAPFLHLIVQTSDFVNAAGVSYGTHMPRSDWAVLKCFPVRLPPAPEQFAIAAAIADMDAELAALEARRDKTRTLKQAMMQELLTGRTRLV